MAHMQPEVIFETMVIEEDKRGESTTYPEEYFDGFKDGSTYHTETGYWSRLNAPGYLDCTDWQGPYKTEGEALQDIMDTFEVDEDGEPLEDDETEEE